MGGWCIPSSELKIYNTWPGYASEAGDTKATQLCPELKVFTGGSDSFAFY